MNNYENRKYILAAIFLVIGIVFPARLFYIQVLNEEFKLSAKNQALRYVTDYPIRGLIYDRNEELLVYNEAAYDLMLIPRDLEAFDTIQFSQLLGLEQEEIKVKINKARKYSRYKASIFEKQISAEEWSEISEQLHKFPGFFGQKRTLRKYPGKAAAHVLGYVSEVNQRIIDKDPYYRAGDYIGASGLERFYEELLRGVRGQKILMVDVHNAIKGSYAEGKYDTLAIPGTNLYTSIDKELQSYGELLMQNKRGSIVAIEPSSGEILCMVSSPGYDPNLLVGRQRNANYKYLAANDSTTPLFNRAINAQYRPGSIFKLAQSLVALEEGVIDVNTRFRCNRGIIGCHGNHSNDKLVEAIQHSCNPYFYQVYKRLIQRGQNKNIFKDSELGLKNWSERIQNFGLGIKLETDLPGILPGMVPNVAFYDRWYGDNRWAFSTIYSNSIGEGELGVVPIQMANFAATIANKGYFISPHFLKNQTSWKRNNTGISPEHFEPVIEAMYKVVNETGGTARRAKHDSIIICGKTGTVQNDPNPDHSVFTSFAPRDQAKIAMAVYVEYSDFGGTWAAPISNLMIEKYLHGSISDSLKEKRILEAEFMDIYEKR